MNVLIDKLFEKVSAKKLNRIKYKVKRLKNINGLQHAVMVEVNDENSEILVAISVLKDKDKFRIL